MLVMRRGGGGIQLYDATRVDCSSDASRTFYPQESLSFFSAAAFSGNGQRIAAMGAAGSTYIFDVRYSCSCLINKIGLVFEECQLFNGQIGKTNL